MLDELPGRVYVLVFEFFDSLVTACRVLLLLAEVLLLSVSTFSEFADLRLASTLLLVLESACLTPELDVLLRSAFEPSAEVRLASPSRALLVDDARADVPAISRLVLFP